MENIVEPVKKDVAKVVNSAELEIQKLKIPLSQHWKSARNMVNDRAKVDFFAKMVGGAGFIASLVATYYEAPGKIQLIFYTFTTNILLLNDSLRLSRIVAKPSRYILCILTTLLCMSIITMNQNMWLILTILTIVSVIMIFFLNSFWIKQEHWKMSREVQHAMHGSKENLPNTHWVAEGRDQTRTLLYSLGVSVDENDLDTMFNATYALGYLHCAKDKAKDIRELKKYVLSLKKDSQDKESLEERISILEADLKTTESNYQHALYFANRYKEERDKALRGDIDGVEKEYEVLVPAEEDVEESESEEVEEEQQESVPTLPRGVSMEQYAQIVVMIDEGDNDNHIETITGVSRYKVNKIRKELGGI